MGDSKCQTSSAQGAPLGESGSGNGPHAQQPEPERSSVVGAAMPRLSERDRKAIIRRLAEMRLSNDGIEAVLAAIEMPAPRADVLAEVVQSTLQMHRSVLALAESMRAMMANDPPDEDTAAPVLDPVGREKGTITKVAKS